MRAWQSSLRPSCSGGAASACGRLRTKTGDYGQGEGQISRENRLHGGVPTRQVQALARDRRSPRDRHRVQDGTERRLGSVAQKGVRAGICVLGNKKYGKDKRIESL